MSQLIGQNGAQPTIEDIVNYLNQQAVYDSNIGAFIDRKNGYRYAALPPELAGNRPVRGTTWQSDTISGFDIYAQGFVQRPTIFFDPTATNSLGYGTYKQPYNTTAQLEARCLGDMSGQVLGWKRGTVLSATTGAGAPSTVGLTFNVYASSGSPFFIVPYGDAEDLPTIDGSRVTGTGTAYVWALSSGSVYRTAVAYDTDLWENGVRCIKRGTTPAAAGEAQYSGGFLYYWPRDIASVNSGSILINLIFDNLHIAPYNVSASGNIVVAGIRSIYARNRCMDISPLSSAYASISTLTGIVIAGCQTAHSGRDASSYTGNASNAAMSFSGISDTVRMGAHVVGNESFDAINNAYEYSATDGLIHEYNYGHDVGGYCVAELYASNVNSTVRYNIGKRSTTKYSDGTNFLNTSVGNGGIWLASNLQMATAWTATAVGAGVQINNNNKAYFNHFEDVQTRFIRQQNGTGHIIQHNTFITNSAANGGDSRFWSSIGIQYDGDAVAGHTNQSNNIFYTDAPAGNSPTYVRLVAATTNLPTGDKNVYYAANLAGGSANWYYSSVGSTGSFTTYKTNTVAASLDQNSWAGVNCAGANLTAVQMAWNTTNDAPGAASTLLAAGLTTLTGIGTMYRNGVAYAPASCNPGAYLGG